MRGTEAAGVDAARGPPGSVQPARIAIHGAEADLARGRIRAPDGTMTELRAQSARVLALLAARRGAIVGKDELHAAVSGDTAVTEDSLVQCIGDIRRALGGARGALRTIAWRGLEPEDARPARVPGRRQRRFAVAALAAVAAALLAAWTWTALHPLPPAKGPVVAVLPFVNASGGERWDRLADGVTDEIIADLGQNDWISVFAKASTAPHAGATPRQVHLALGADYVVTGSVRAEGGRARIAAALVDAPSGRQVWSEDWLGPPDDLLALQISAAEALAGELAGSYTGAIARAGRARARAKTASLAAYDLYLLASEHKHRFTEADLHLAREYYLKAVALDPGFAKAWVGASIAQGFLTATASSPAELAALMADQRTYIERAVAADPDDPTVLLEASRLDAIDGDLDAAARRIRRAVERAPNDADVLAVAAWSAPERAQLAAEAVEWADRALALNPERPDWYMAAKGQAAFAAGDDAAALAALKQGPRDYVDGWVIMAAAAANLGDRAAAEAAVAALHRLVPDFDLDLYLSGWPWEPTFAARLRDGATRAGLGR